MPTLDEVLADAQRLAKSASGARPTFEPAAYEQAMLDLAAQEARGLALGASLAKLQSDRDLRLAALAAAHYAAETHADQRRRSLLASRAADLRKRHATETESPPDGSPRAQLYRAMEAYAACFKRAGEDTAEAMGRLLLAGDAALAKLCAQYDALGQ